MPEETTRTGRDMCQDSSKDVSQGSSGGAQLCWMPAIQMRGDGLIRKLGLEQRKGQGICVRLLFCEKVRLLGGRAFSRMAGWA